MATATERSRLRRDTGSDVSSLEDSAIDAIFVEAAERYTDTATATAYTRVLAIQGILASSAKLTSYRANESQENLSDVFKHLKDLLAIWEAKVDDAITAAAGSSGAARFGGLRRKPAKVREYPGWQ
jgi:uncharacterized BrkB/YihY/UPF0761 family membrane protein